MSVRNKQNNENIILCWLITLSILKAIRITCFRTKSCMEFFWRIFWNFYIWEFFHLQRSAFWIFIKLFWFSNAVRLKRHISQKLKINNKTFCKINLSILKPKVKKRFIDESSKSISLKMKTLQIAQKLKMGLWKKWNLIYSIFLVTGWPESVTLDLN